MIKPVFFCKKLFIAIVFTMLTCMAVNAGVIEDIAHDFEPVSGYIVMSDQDDFIIDLDESQGISVGDIFSVIKPGKKIVHPVTKKVLGTLEEVKGILKVTRIKTGYSFARAIGDVSGVKRGDPIRRYGNLPALFWDYTGKGLPVFIQLQKTLTDLRWMDYNQAQKSRPSSPGANSETRKSLTFILTESGLEVRDPEFMEIRTYDYQASDWKSTGEPSKVSRAAPAAAPAVAATRAKPETKATAPVPAPKKTADIKMVSPSFSDVETLASLPDVAIVIDFIHLDNRLLMASSNSRQILIIDVTNNLKTIAEGAPDHPAKILSLKWWVPREGENPYLAANVWSDRDKKVRGNLFRFDGTTLMPIIENIPRILGSFDSDGDGRPEMLLGQEFKGDTFFGRRLAELKLNGDKIDYVRPRLELPRNFTVLGSLLADVTGDGKMETIYVRNRNLYVYSEKKRLYKSPKQMGGSLSFLTYAKDPTVKDLHPTSVEFEISPVVYDLDGDGIAEILAVASDRNFLGSLSISDGVKKSWLAVFKYDNGRCRSYLS